MRVPTLIKLGLAVVLVSLAAIAGSLTLSYTTGGSFQNGLGCRDWYCNPANPLDRLTLSSFTGTATLVSGISQDLLLNPAVFDVGVNTTYGGFTDTGLTSQSLTINGVTGTIANGYAISISWTDFIQLSQGAAVNFNLTKGTVSVTPLALAMGPNAGGETYGNLMGRFEYHPQMSTTGLGATPEPGSMALAGCGLTASAYLARRRRSIA